MYSEIKDYSILEVLFIILFLIILMLFFMNLMIYVHTMIHELGHLLFGFVTGYEFLSIRIGKGLIYKVDGRYKFTFLKETPSAGQCLMYPTQRVYERKAFLLYQLGGIIGNLSVGILSILILIIIYRYSYLLNILLIQSFLCGITFSITNIFKNPFTKVINDGMNLNSLLKSDDVIKCFYQQLEIYKMLLHNISYKNMNNTIAFKKELLRENLVAYSQLLNYYQYLDRLEFDKAYGTLEPYYSEYEVLELDIRKELERELIFCETLNHCSSILQKTNYNFLTTDIRNIHDINELRVRYALELYTRNNKNTLKIILEKMNQVCKGYVYTSDITMNMDLIKYLDAIRKDQNG